MATSSIFDTTREPRLGFDSVEKGDSERARSRGVRLLVLVGVLLWAVGAGACVDCRSGPTATPSSQSPTSEQVESTGADERSRSGTDSGRSTANSELAAEVSRDVETSDAPGVRASSDEPARILALGDSYTVGVGVEESERWPAVLAERLRSEGHRVADPTRVATGGWTTRQLLDALEERSLEREFDVVAVLIGTNDALSNLPPDRYREEYRTVLDRATALAGGEPSRVVALTLPDYSVTPTAERIGVAKAARDVETFNDIIREEADAAGAAVVDLAPASSAIEENPKLLADALHPGAEIHRAWVRRMLYRVKRIVEPRTD